MSTRTEDLKDAAEDVGGFLAVMGLIVGLFLLRVWLVMLMIGALHAGVPEIPALGFGPSALAVVILWVATWSPRGGRTES